LISNGVDVLEPMPTFVVRSMISRFVEHVKPLSADEDFGISGRKLDLAVSMARKS